MILKYNCLYNIILKYNCFLILDIHALLYRYGYGCIKLKNNQQKNIGAIHGIFNLIWKLSWTWNFTNIFFVFDSPTSSQNNKKIFSDYKKNRIPMPIFLIEQIKILILFLQKINFHIYSIDYFEGDDIIYNIAILLHKKYHKNEILIISTDKDLLQLLSLNRITVFLINKIWKQFYTKFDVYEKYGIFPYQIPDFLALAGDQSDNIPGIRNIGKITAKKLLQKFQNIQKLILQYNKIFPIKIRKKIINNKNLLIKFKILTSLKLIPNFRLYYNKKLKYSNLEIKTWLKQYTKLNNKQINNIINHIFIKLQ